MLELVFKGDDSYVFYECFFSMVTVILLVWYWWGYVVYLERS